MNRGGRPIEAFPSPVLVALTFVLMPFYGKIPPIKAGLGSPSALSLRFSGWENSYFSTLARFFCTFTLVFLAPISHVVLS